MHGNYIRFFRLYSIDRSNYFESAPKFIHTSVAAIYIKFMFFFFTMTENFDRQFDRQFLQGYICEDFTYV